MNPQTIILATIVAGLLFFVLEEIIKSKLK